MTAALLLAACGDGGSPTDVIECAPNAPWAQADRCERGCANGPGGGGDLDQDGYDDVCRVASGDPEFRCRIDWLTTYDDIRGCCVPALDQTRVHTTIEFRACEGE